MDTIFQKKRQTFWPTILAKKISEKVGDGEKKSWANKSQENNVHRD
jgi:hypothetical protein